MALLKAETDVNAASLERVTPLIGRELQGRPDVMQRLLGAGAATDPTDRMKKPAMANWRIGA